ncbi:MAG: thioredoxin family protein [Sphingobium sp.]
MMGSRRIGLALALAACVAGCQKEDTAKPQAAATQAIAWRHGDVTDALAEAKEGGKPVFLYWGAKWCPPCNQMKSTLFKDAAFIERTRGFVPVYLDGDSPGAQRWGERFGISGYPTVILLRPDGEEITRLSAASAPTRLADVLRVAAGRSISTEALLEKAQGDPKALSKDDWQLLADYDWQNDPRHFSDSARAVTLLDRLAGTAPDPALQHRFALLALVIGAEEKDDKVQLTAAQQAKTAELLPAILANPAEVTANRQELSYAAAPLILALPDAATRAKLGGELVGALDRVYADKALPIPDRLGTGFADIALADGKVPPALLTKVRERAAWADSTAKDAMVRQSAISTAADLLHEAGDTAGAKQLLEAELKRSASPYYYMLGLSRIAEDEKDGKAAVEWARKAYEGSEGPATRVQWAIEYSKAVLRLTPGDKQAVERSASAVIDELGKNGDGYYQRTRTKVAAWGKLLRSWSEKHGESAVLGRFEARMADVCARQGEGAASCRNWAQAG